MVLTILSFLHNYYKFDTLQFTTLSWSYIYSDLLYNSSLVDRHNVDFNRRHFIYCNYANVYLNCIMPLIDFSQHPASGTLLYDNKRAETPVCLTYLCQTCRTAVEGVLEHSCSPRPPGRSVPQTRRTAALESQQQTCSHSHSASTIEMINYIKYTSCGPKWFLPLSVVISFSL